MPTSSTPLDAASNTSNGGTIAPPGWVSIFTRPPDIFSTVSAQSLKMRCRLADAGWVDCPFSTICAGAFASGAAPLAVDPGSSLLQAATMAAAASATATNDERLVRLDMAFILLRVGHRIARRAVTLGAAVPRCQAGALVNAVRPR